jgi:hypothetical protein
MPRSAAEERGGRNKFFKWRAMKKDLMLAYAKGNEKRAWEQLRKMMLLTNRQFQEIKEDKLQIDINDEFRL